MAAFTRTPLRVTDSANNPVSGGKLRLYLNGTTTLASVYSDAAQTTPLANPVVADAAGWLPMIFATEGTSVDGAFLDASNAVISGTSFTDSVFVGDTSGDISRDFDANGRFAVRGAGGLVHVEVGDPAGDDAGGEGRFGGWSGTQGDSLEVDFAEVNFTGKLTVKDKKLPGVVYTEATSFSAASQVDITLPNDPTGVRAWEIEIFDLTMSAIANLQARFSFDNGVNFKAGASDYVGQFATMSSGSASVSSQGAAAQMTLCGNLQGATNKPTSGRLIITTPNSGSDWTSLRGQLQGLDNASVYTLATPFYSTATTYGRATNLRLLPASGTITGKYLVRPLYGFGDA